MSGISGQSRPRLEQISPDRQPDHKGQDQEDEADGGQPAVPAQELNAAQYIEV